MARFILEYDVKLESSTKGWILDNVPSHTPSFLKSNDDTVHFCLEDLIDEISVAHDRDFLLGSKEDRKYLKKLLDEGVDYIEICL